MASTQAICTSFKVECLEGVHNFTATTGDVFKMALYTSSATMDATTTAYSATNEVTGTGYTAGGMTITQVTPTFGGTTAFVDFADPTWTTATITARYALIYNSSKANRAVVVLDFGADKISTGGNFTVQFPTPDSTNAIVRLN